MVTDRFPHYHTLAAFGGGLMGWGNIFSAWLIYHPTRISWLRHYIPGEVLQGSWLSSVVAGSVQLFLSWSLGRRKRQAWLITVVMLLYPWPGSVRRSWSGPHRLARWFLDSLNWESWRF